MSGNEPQGTMLIPDAPTLTNQYKVLELLGEGGMGRVYKAEHKITGQVVAVKVLRQELLSDPSFRVRFITEAKALSRLDHPSITHLYNFMEEADGRLFLIMQFVAGQNLESLVFAVGALPPSVALTIFLHILRAFAYAHEQGVVHRDIKPANIVLTHGGGVKVMDFGIARIDSGSRITMTGASLGSPGYMSPEQVLGRPLDHRCDIYALGVMLFEMVAGDLPFPGDNGYTVMKAHVEQPVPDPRKIVPVPDKMAEAIMAAMRKNPDDRPQTVDQLAAMLPTLDELGGNEEDAWRFVFGETHKGKKGAHTLGGPPPVRHPSSGMGVALPGPSSGTLAHQSSVLPPLQTISPQQSPVHSTLSASVPVPLNANAGGSRNSRSVVIGGMLALGLLGGAAWYATRSTPNAAVEGKGAAGTVPTDLPSTLVVKGSEMVLIPSNGTGDAFYMDRAEVTYRQYRAWLQDCAVGSACGPSKPNPILDLQAEELLKVIDHPVSNVNHSDASAYCRYAEKRLPSSDDWTRAASGADKRNFPWGNEAFAGKAWLARTVVEGDGYYSTMKSRPGGLPTVSTHSEEYYNDESPYGVLGLGGNLSEWLADTDPKDKNLFLIAGGSWSSSDPASEAKNTERSSNDAEFGSLSVGFRCVADAAVATRLGKPDLMSLIQKQGSLKVGAEAETPPMLMKNDKGELEGFEYELMQHIASSLGIKLEVISGPYPELPARLRSGKFQVLLSAYTPDDAIRGVEWSTPYLDYGLCLVVGKNSAIKKVEDLASKKVGHYNDPATAKAVKALVPTTTKLVVLENNYLDAVKDGQVDAFLYDFPLLMAEIKAYQETLRISQFGLTEATYNAAVPDGEYSLLRAVNRSIWSLRHSEKYTALLQKYLGGAAPVNDIPAGARTTIVKQGDTLELVAQRELGDGKRWPEIWSLNKFRMGNQNLLYVGTPLVLPSK